MNTTEPLNHPIGVRNPAELVQADIATINHIAARIGDAALLASLLADTLPAGNQKVQAGLFLLARDLEAAGHDLTELVAP